MSQFNLKFISSLLILALGVTEILVFNEEVFIFVCFFIFFNLISVFAGGSLSQAFQDVGSDLEKNFLQTSQEAKATISALVLSKAQALGSIARVFVFLKAFRNVAVQKSLLFASESFVQNVHFCFIALNAFKSRSLESSFSSNPVAQAFAINSKRSLKSFYLKRFSFSSVAKGVFVAPKPKQQGHFVDRLLSVGFLSASKITLS
jgi:hypothetical protein